MPTFPVPRHEIPACLNPFNLRHWWLLAYWVYCCPSELKYYLYRADPAFYRAKTKPFLLQAWQIKAYRNLCLCIVPTAVLCFAAFSLPILWKTQGLNNIAWQSCVLGFLIALFMGFLHLLTYGPAFAASMSNGAGMANGVTLGMAVSGAQTVMLTILLGTSFDWDIGTLVNASNLNNNTGLEFIPLFSLAVGVGTFLSMDKVVGGLASLLVGLTSGAGTWLLLKVVVTTVPSIGLTCLALAAMVGLCLSGSYGSAPTMGSLLVGASMTGAIMGIAIVAGLSRSGIPIEISILYGIAALLIIWAGMSRFFPLYVFYGLYLSLGSMLASVFGVQIIRRHPIEWDELLILPLPGAQRYLEQVLNKNEAQGMGLMVRLAKNPMQRPMVQRVFKKYLLQKNEFIQALYLFLQNPIGDDYITPPNSPEDWDLLPTGKQVLLGELSSKWVNCAIQPSSLQVEKFLGSLTWFQRNHKEHAYIDFAKLLYRLSFTFKTYTHTSNLEELTPKYSDIFYRPGGQEIIESFKAVVTFSSYEHLHQLATAEQAVVNLPPVQSAIRPQIIDTLNALADIAQDITIAESSRSLLLQQSSLLRANNALDKLRQKIVTDIVLPETKLLEIVIGRWLRLVTETGGQVGRLTKPLPLLNNPYIIGTPVKGEDFIGRDDILRYITDELLAGTKQCPPIVLYGHRRMGKTSILKNLSTRLKSTNIRVVDFNMQIVGHISSTNELLYALARQIARAIQSSDILSKIAIDRTTFIEQNPYHAFNNFFQRLESALACAQCNYRFVIAVDEFEKIEEKIINQQLSKDLLEFLRGLTQTYSWFSIIFAGLHTIEEMCFDYWSPFFTSIPIRVSFLSAQSTERLLLQAGDIGYDSNVIPKVVELTHGQPYLVQLIGYTLIRFFNRNRLEKPITTSKYPVFNADDLDVLICSPEFYTIGNAYFQGVWLQAQHGQPSGQTEILKQLTLRPRSEAELIEAIALPPKIIIEALRTLQSHDVVQQKENQFSYQVELMRRWVKDYQLE